MPAATPHDEVDLLIGKMKTAAAPLRDVLRDLHARYAAVDEGKVADYIPELAKADRRWFGIAVATPDGQVFEVGDCKQLFTIQSISKPFVYGLALEDHGLEHVLSKVGVEPTGEAFNAIVLDEASNRPFNPMVNAGAIATADLIKGKDFPERVGRLLAMFGKYCGRDVYIDNSVFMSEGYQVGVGAVVEIGSEVDPLAGSSAGDLGDNARFGIRPPPIAGGVYFGTARGAGHEYYIGRVVFE